SFLVSVCPAATTVRRIHGHPGRSPSADLQKFYNCLTVFQQIYNFSTIALQLVYDDGRWRVGELMRAPRRVGRARTWHTEPQSVRGLEESMEDAATVRFGPFQLRQGDQ